MLFQNPSRLPPKRPLGGPKVTPTSFDHRRSGSKLVNCGLLVKPLNPSGFCESEERTSRLSEFEIEWFNPTVAERSLRSCERWIRGSGGVGNPKLFELSLVRLMSDSVCSTRTPNLRIVFSAIG